MVCFPTLKALTTTVRDLESSYPATKKALRDFERIHLGIGEIKEVNFVLDSADFMVIDDEGNRLLEPGEFEILLGGNSVDMNKVTLAVGL